MICGTVGSAGPRFSFPEERRITRTSQQDPLAGSVWSDPGTVAGFAASSPNADLIDYAHRLKDHGTNRLLDIGCGAGRNAVALAEHGWTVIGADLSLVMLRAGARRSTHGRVSWVLAPMDTLPIADGSMDVIVAHGIWNLAGSGTEFRRAIAEAARVCRPGGALFVFTFSRNTLPASAQPVDGETIVYTQFSGRPQCFVTATQLLEELSAAGFTPDPNLPLRELNRPSHPAMRTGAPVIFQGGFCFRR